MVDKLEEGRIPNTPRKANQEYVGSYYNLIKDYYIEIFEKSGELFMCHQNDRFQSYQLKHFNDDSFSWLFTRDECTRRSLFSFTNLEFYILRFGMGDDDKIDQIYGNTTSLYSKKKLFVEHPDLQKPSKRPWKHRLAIKTSWDPKVELEDWPWLISKRCDHFCYYSLHIVGTWWLRELLTIWWKPAPVASCNETKSDSSELQFELHDCLRPHRKELLIVFFS